MDIVILDIVIAHQAAVDIDCTHTGSLTFDPLIRDSSLGLGIHLSVLGMTRGCKEHAKSLSMICQVLDKCNAENLHIRWLNELLSPSSAPAAPPCCVSHQEDPEMLTLCSCGVNKTFFHYACLLQWINKHSYCPACR